VLAAAFVAAVARRPRIAAGMRRGDQAVIDAKRHRNSIFAVIEHTGRRSGRRYTTPIRVVERPGGFIVPLTYGPKTNWYVNLRAGPGQLHWQGRTITVGNPTIVPTSLTARLFPLPTVPALARPHRRVRGYR